MVVITAVMLAGCAYSIKDIDTSKVDQACARECTTAYSSCVSPSQIGFKTETLRACREGYEACVSTCPTQ